MKLCGNFIIFSFVILLINILNTNNNNNFITIMIIMRSLIIIKRNIIITKLIRGIDMRDNYIWIQNISIVVNTGLFIIGIILKDSIIIVYQVFILLYLFIYIISYILYKHSDSNVIYSFNQYTVEQDSFNQIHDIRQDNSITPTINNNQTDLDIFKTPVKSNSSNSLMSDVGFCAICLCDGDKDDEFMLDCGHSFHGECLQLCINNNFLTCPLCRQNI